MYDPRTLRAGDVILVNGAPPGEAFPGRLLDLAIGWATVSPFHHAAIVSTSGTLIEALWRVTESPADKYASCAISLRPFCAAKVCAKAAQWASSRVGDRYGIAEILEDGGRDILHLPIGWRFHPRHLTCSGLVAASYVAAGAPLTRAPVPSPADLSYSPILVGRRPWEHAPPHPQ